MNLPSDKARARLALRLAGDQPFLAVDADDVDVGFLTPLSRRRRPNGHRRQDGQPSNAASVVNRLTSFPLASASADLERLQKVIRQ